MATWVTRLTKMPGVTTASGESSPSATLARTCIAPDALGLGPETVAGDLPWERLSQLDAGAWHSRAWVGEPVPTLDNMARYCLHNGYHLNIEIKPTPGQEALTGRVVAEHVAHLWRNADVPPLLTSFQPPALAAARSAAPARPQGLLLDTLPTDWLTRAQALGCIAVVCNHALWNPDTVAQASAAGLKTLSYTVNDEWAAERLWALKTDGIITDRVDLFSPEP